MQSKNPPSRKATAPGLRHPLAATPQIFMFALSAFAITQRPYGNGRIGRPLQEDDTMSRENTEISRGAYWTGVVLSTLVVLFLIFDGVIKLAPLQVVIDTMQGLGYPPEHARTIGVITLAGTVLYALPRTSILGAVLLTGLLGGAIATNLRAGTPIFTHLLFGVYLGVLMWGALYLRDARVRAILPLLR